MFKSGDIVVYPAHGVGVIEAVEDKDLYGIRQSFYILRILDNNMIIMIPIQNVDTVGLRGVIPKSQIKKVYSILEMRDVSLDHQTWNRRYREYMEKIKTGSVFELAEVLRDLFLLKADKELSFGERKMLDTAKNLLVKELSISKNTAEEKIEKDIQTIFGN
jgi:CarD family transcriptional regulator